jgi:hypothetical protein
MEFSTAQKFKAAFLPVKEFCHGGKHPFSNGLLSIKLRVNAISTCCRRRSR